MSGPPAITATVPVDSAPAMRRRIDARQAGDDDEAGGPEVGNDLAGRRAPLAGALRAPTTAAVHSRCG